MSILPKDLWHTDWSSQGSNSLQISRWPALPPDRLHCEFQVSLYTVLWFIYYITASLSFSAAFTFTSGFQTLRCEWLKESLKHLSSFYFLLTFVFIVRWTEITQFSDAGIIHVLWLLWLFYSNCPVNCSSFVSWCHGVNHTGDTEFPVESTSLLAGEKLFHLRYYYYCNYLYYYNYSVILKKPEYSHNRPTPQSWNPNLKLQRRL